MCVLGVPGGDGEYRRGGTGDGGASITYTTDPWLMHLVLPLLSRAVPLHTQSLSYFGLCLVSEICENKSKKCLILHPKKCG